jgi:Sec-independent protein translocase protein TatA
VILAVGFILVGPKELPGAARKFSAGMWKLRSLQDDLRAELGTVLELPDQ